MQIVVTENPDPGQQAIDPGQQATDPGQQAIEPGQQATDPGQQVTETQAPPHAAGVESPNVSGMDVDSTPPVENSETGSDVTARADNSVEEIISLEPQDDSVKTETVVGTEKPSDSVIQSSDLFSSFAQDRILGLIGALMPPNRQVTL